MTSVYTGFFNMLKTITLFTSFCLCLLSTQIFAQVPLQEPHSYSSNTIIRLEEEIRQLRGQNEKLQHEINQLKASQQRFQEDIEFRLNGTTSPTPMPGSIPPNAPASGSMGEYKIPSPEVPFQPPIATPTPANDSFTSSPNPQTLRMPDPNFSTPRDLYNHAFRLLNKTDYDGAERAFAKFINDYPNDPLIGNAWYWMGETFYVRREYVRAADSFRQGFESLETGPKAGDNLLKLAMSLAAMEKDQEACVVLKQVESNYAKNSESLANKAKQEISRLGC